MYVVDPASHPARHAEETANTRTPDPVQSHRLHAYVSNCPVNLRGVIIQHGCAIKSK